MKKHRILLSFLLVSVFLLAKLPLAVSAEDDSLMLAEVKKGVVQIWATGYAGDKSFSNPVAAWSGTGFAVGTAGEDSDVFLTNWHVVTGSDFDIQHTRVWILLDNATLDEYYVPNPATAVECEVLYTTTGYPDFAVIRALEPIQGFKALPLLSSEEVMDGARVYALGYPGVVDGHSASNSGIDDITITTGVVSKHMTMTDAGNTDVLLHDAHIQGGNSGGPLVTSKGAAVGLNTYGFGEDYRTEYSCAVYIDYAMAALDELNIHYDIYTPEQAKETVESGDTEGETESSQQEEDSGSGEDGSEEDSEKRIDPMYILIAAVAVLGIAVVVLLVVKRRPRQEPSVSPSVPPVSDAGTPAPPPVNEIPMPIGFMLKAPDGSIVPIPEGGLTIGRDPSCQIRLPEGSRGVSRRHCRLDCRGGVLTLTDIGSTYGTFVRGKKLPVNTPVAVRQGSSFYLGAPENSFTVC